MSKNAKAIGQAVGLGIVAGMRATVAPAVLSRHFRKHPSAALAQSGLRFIQSPVAGMVTRLLSLAEVAGDKLPVTPNRTIAPQVLARVASGAFAGAVVFQSRKSSIVKGMLIGGVSALAATYATFFIRKYVDKLPHVKDAVVGTVEDLVSVGAGLLLLKD